MSPMNDRTAERQLLYEAERIVSWSIAELVHDLDYETRLTAAMADLITLVERFGEPVSNGDVAATAARWTTSCLDFDHDDPGGAEHLADHDRLCEELFAWLEGE